MPVDSQLLARLSSSAKEVDLKCYHCGESCPDDRIHIEDKHFCCEGCKMVFEILNSNDLCQYYQIDENAGVSLRGKSKEEYAYLDEPEVKSRLVDFSDGDKSRITFFIPSIHCASCIWLLENLYKLNDGVLSSTVHFPKKEIYITYSEQDTSLRKVVELLDSIGYTPAINLGDLDEDSKPLVDRSFYYKLGVAGFAFGNIMLLSFPEYLGLEQATDDFFFRLFGYLNIILSLPVVLYSARDYWKSAWLGLSQKQLNIDVPITLGVFALFGRSVFEILTHTGAGYLDSLAGLIFFLLIGKWFQQRTYHNISFERDYRSYFPIAARKKEGGEEVSVSLDRLSPGDIILVRNRELVPADSILLKGEARIDYSFVTGESEPVTLKTGEKIFAGGKQMGAAIELSLVKKVSQSYLTQLWNDEAFTKKQDSAAGRLADKVGRNFTYAILLISFTTLFYWLPRDSSIAINAFTAVLIIACPCAVALAIPFIFGNVLRILGRRQFYLKNTSVIEALRDTDAVVFDKTGTITQRGKGAVEFVGEPLNDTEAGLIRELVRQSNHPASRQIFKYLTESLHQTGRDTVTFQEWNEEIGRGISGVADRRLIKLGHPSFINASASNEMPLENGVILQIDNDIRGYFQISNHFREGVREVLEFFRQNSDLHLLSGDDDRERALLTPFFRKGESLHFRQSPKDKLMYIKNLQAKGRKVLMLGDGLNDAGALQQSDAGIVVAEDTNNFTPACDAILSADQFDRLPLFVDFARKSVRLVFMAYGFAFIYNVIGLSFAVQGALSPIIAAILMPLSSISIVLFGMLTSNWLAARMGLREKPG
jgi:P-type Cu+ transporter